MNAILVKLIPGTLAILVIGGAGLFIGTRIKQAEIDKLQAQLTEYQMLGRHVAELKSVIDASIKEKNQALVDAYSREIDKVRSDFGSARSGLASATEALKQGGRNVGSSAGAIADAIAKLPVGSPEREGMIAQALVMLNDEGKRQKLCAITPVDSSQLLTLKSSFAIGAP